MCGIVGYIGNREAQPILLNCLSKLEYRGYDSCGIAICGKEIKQFKNAGRVRSLIKILPSISGNVGIGHTRWATHGIPNTINAHPHFDCSGKIAVVHNGIVRNYQEIKQKLIREGHTFLSETDTEVIPHLIEKYFQGDLAKAVELALKDIEGTFAVVVIKEGNDEIIVSRKDSPLIIGLGDGENFIASDVPAILDYTNRVIYLDNGDIGLVNRNHIKLLRNGSPVQPVVHTVPWNSKEVEMGGYPHFMIKEIHEQVRVIQDSLAGYSLDNSNLFNDLNDLQIIACGTSYHAGLIGKYLIEEILGIPVRVELGSEYNHRSRIIIPSLTILLSQSGETADVLLALKKLQETKASTTAITNVLGSSISRVAESVIYTKAGPEISVAATKTFIAQLIELYKLVFSSSRIGSKPREEAIKTLRLLPSKIQQLIDDEAQYEKVARYLSEFDTVFYVGRGINYPIALEGALKMKEISYIHAEGYAAGELKHGPFALLDKNTPVVAFVAQDDTRDSMISNIKEIKARQSPVIVIADERDDTISSVTDKVIRVPNIPSLFSPMINTIPAQLLAYYAAKYRGCPIDYPRNLAKSVTVE